MNPPNIKTAFINPPIASRFSDWAAWVDGREEDTTHTAGTEEEAIQAVLRQLEEEKP